MKTVIWGTVPYVLCMFLAIVILSVSRRSPPGCPTT